MDNVPVIPLEDNEHILFLGDSLTRRGARRAGFITLISKTLRAIPALKSVKITCSGVSGNRVPDLLSRLDRDVLRKKPTLVIVYIGINDVWHSQFGRGTPEAEFKSGLHSLLGRLCEGGARVLLCTPSVIGEKSAGQNPLDGKLDRYAEMIREAAAHDSIPLLDLRRLFLAHLQKVNTHNHEKGLLTSDGVHLNTAGNRFVAECMLKLFCPEHPYAE
jgi:lysophospholipase L1-like esterase